MLENIKAIANPPENLEELSQWCEATDRVLLDPIEGLGGKMESSVRILLRTRVRFWGGGHEEVEYPRAEAYIAWPAILAGVESAIKESL